MSLKDLDIKISYKSMDGLDTIPKSFISPCLSNAILYQRSVGYFSSTVFSSIFEGINNLKMNNGRIQLVTTPMLKKEDVETIKLGLKVKNKVFEENVGRIFDLEINKLNDQNLMILFELVSKGKLEIKIATTNSNGEYHDKLGIIHDLEGNIITFYGSSNSSDNGYVNNYEKIRVSRSWVDAEKIVVEDEMQEFIEIWEGLNPYINTFEFTEAARQGIIREVSRRGLKINGAPKSEIQLRDYQNEAIKAWEANGYKGFFVMATGTGKTFTAIFALKQLLDVSNRIVVIVAPYKHLLEQWKNDLVKIFPNAKIIKAFSENPNWDNQIKNEMFRLNYDRERRLIIISTMKSFYMPRFEESLCRAKLDRVLVVDEAHRFTQRSNDILANYKNLLGLSATPTNGKNVEESKNLVEFFGGVVFNLPIEKALEKGYLVKYNYYPIFVTSDALEEDDFQKISIQMASCFFNGVCIDKDKLLKLSRRRLRLISNIKSKLDSINEIIKNIITTKDHLVVYCGDGKLFDSDNDSERYINYVKKILNDQGLKPSQFTADETMDERMQLVELFDKGIIDSLVAIRCLDEGINIPSIKSALILSSNDDLREFVQRRGRILRKHENKTHADIYDVVVLPSVDTPGLAKIDLRRMYEYARLSMNYELLTNAKIKQLLTQYGLSLDEIKINDIFLEEDYDE